MPKPDEALFEPELAKAELATTKPAPSGVHGSPSLDKTDVFEVDFPDGPDGAPRVRTPGGVSSQTSTVPLRTRGPARPPRGDESTARDPTPEEVPRHDVPILEPRALRIQREGSDDLVVPLYPDRSYVVGRAPECSFVFPNEGVSRQHGRLSVRQDGKWVYRDLGSANGSFLSVEPAAQGRIVGAMRVKPGQDVLVGAGMCIHLGNDRGRIVFLHELPEGLSASQRSALRMSRAAQLLEESIDVCSQHRLPVFLIGSSGTGKTHVAREIHKRSRMDGTFVIINCGRLPTDPAQLTSELLGHVEGAYTGANIERVGKFAAAHQGTLFLDEVEFLPPAAQDFLVDVLEGSGSFAPLGAPAGFQAPAPVFRLISASKQPLGQSGLRADLCERLAAADVIPLPSLDERREDIPALVEEFLRQMKTEQAIRAELSGDALQLLQHQPWPGQIRELESTVKVVVATEHARHRLQGKDSQKIIISAEAVQAHLARRRIGFGGRDAPPQAPMVPLADTLHGPGRKRPADLGAQDIRDALALSNGNKTHAAQMLGIAVNTLKARMRQLGMEAPPRSGKR